MVQFILSAHQVGHLGQRLQRLHRLDVHRHGDFAHTDGPHVEVVDVDDVVAARLVNVLAHLLDVDGLGGALHHDDDNVLDNWDSRAEDDDREEVRAEGVRVPECREEVDDRGSDDHTHAHQHVAHHVQERSIDVDVALVFVLVVVSVAMAVTMVVPVAVSVAVSLSLVSLLILEKVLLHRFVLDMVMTVAVSVGVAVIMPVAVTMTVSVAVSVVVVVVAVVMIVLVLATKMVVAVARVQNFHLDEVEDEAHHGDDEHDVTLDLRGHEEALASLNEEPASHDPDRGDRDEGADDLGSVPTVSQVPTRGLLRHVEGQD
mmetsp:Transcript_24399/g.32661  ORF Transcript_24399/g.32661 Transcript_24399/m.32661 type:complete len:316 (+) Transcript_24399:248-1195(+)